jgi:glycine/D-amino acid oxidase-like deaminating enzyme
MSSTFPWPSGRPTSDQRASFADAETRAFWLDDLDAGDALAPLSGVVDADLCIVGGGFTGLWAALHAKADDPARDVVVLEAQTAGFGASGRNGGFAVPSLTHGIANGMSRFAGEIEVLERLGRENLDGLVADCEAHGIDCEFERTGELLAILEPYQDAWLTEEAELLRRFGHDVEVFGSAESMQAEVASPLYRGGVWDRGGGGVLHPGKLAVGLRDACVRAGVRIHENTTATGLATEGAAVVVRTTAGRVRADRVVLATSAFPPLLRRIGLYIVPVYDYVLVTEPLTAAQRASLGWSRRQGIGDGANQFHYYRLTSDDRVLFGGYDAVYRFGGRVHPKHDTDDAVFGRLAQHFFTTFPQLEGVRFSHKWGGAIDTCSRFSVFFGTAMGGRVSYATGYTGLGVAATRFGARVALDLVDGRETEATRLDYVRSKPVPFPPEPLRWGVVQLTRNRLAAADRREGRRGLWLRTLDRMGLGFDS